MTETDNSFLLPAFRDALNAIKPGWEIVDNGITGPQGALVRLAQRHESDSTGHVDIQFILGDEATGEENLWDCVSGFGDTPQERAQVAAHIWASTTVPALLELKYSRRGEFADHYRGNETGGFAGWHIICGEILGFGQGDTPTQLQSWWLDHSVLPTIGRALEGSMTEASCPHGVKILFGGDGIAEIRLNGDRHDAASETLAALRWPRLNPYGFVRTYALVLHRDS